MHQLVNDLDKVPSSVASLTSVAVVGNGTVAWLDGVSSVAGAVTTILGLPIALLVLLYWWRKVKALEREMDKE